LVIPESRSICVAYCGGLIFLAPAPGVIAFGVLINLYYKVVELGAGSESTVGTAGYGTAAATGAYQTNNYVTVSAMPDGTLTLPISRRAAATR
jgi:hypothetical protein